MSNLHTTAQDRLNLLQLLLTVEGHRLRVWAEPNPPPPPPRPAVLWTELVDTAWDVHPKMALNLGVGLESLLSVVSLVATRAMKNAGRLSAPAAMTRVPHPYLILLT